MFNSPQNYKHPFSKKCRGLTLYELLAIVVSVIIVTIIAIRIPLFSFRRNIECSIRLVCASNLKGIGTSSKIYANDHSEYWPVPAFDENQIGKIDYTVNVGGGEGSVRSPNRMQPSKSGEGGTRQLSVTRAYWMLVRSGDISEQQFICPQSGNTISPHEKSGAYLEKYYDFSDYSNISYGFRPPFGPKQSRAYDSMDNRMILAADKGPYIDATISTPPHDLLSSIINLKSSDSIKVWKKYNARNHNGEGQNVLFADGHVEFKRWPIVGIDNDNIYTVALDNSQPKSYIMGESPWVHSAHPYTPSNTLGNIASTDSLIFP